MRDYRAQFVQDRLEEFEKQRIIGRASRIELTKRQLQFRKRTCNFLRRWFLILKLVLQKIQKKYKISKYFKILIITISNNNYL